MQHTYIATSVDSVTQVLDANVVGGADGGAPVGAALGVGQDLHIASLQSAGQSAPT